MDRIEVEYYYQTDGSVIDLIFKNGFQIDSN